MSHDRYFINRTATRILELTSQSFINYIGNYDYYLEKKEDVEAAFLARRAAEASAPSARGPISQEPSVSSSQSDWKARKEEQARLRKRQNELKKTEEAIHELEQGWGGSTGFWPWRRSIPM